MTKEHIDFRPALPEDASKIWQILQQAIERRRMDGSAQWQDGYPNSDVVAKDIESNKGFVLTVDGEIAVYGAIFINNEPAYERIVGSWLSSGDFVAVHRVAVHQNFQGKGMVKAYFEKTEEYARAQNIFSVKVDTNFDNPAMLNILQKTGYTYCGKVFFRGSERLAYEKTLA